jgi:hypothetical protein
MSLTIRKSSRNFPTSHIKDDALRNVASDVVEFCRQQLNDALDEIDVAVNTGQDLSSVTQRLLELSAQIANEAAARASADTAITTDYEAEFTNVNNSIALEQVTRSNADDALDVRVTSLEACCVSAGASLLSLGASVLSLGATLVDHETRLDALEVSDSYVETAVGITLDDTNGIVKVTAACTIVLPPLATVKNGRAFVIDAAADGVVVDGDNAETITGELTQTLYTGDSMTVYKGNTEWRFK